MIANNPNGLEIFGPKYWTGIVSYTRENTASVLVNRKSPDPKYQKSLPKSKNYLVHDPERVCCVGDKVLFEKSRPHSKRKHFIHRVILKKSEAVRYLKENPDVKRKLSTSHLSKAMEKEKKEHGRAVWKRKHD